MPKAVNCTEMEQTIADIAAILASTRFKNEVNQIDKIAEEMKKHVPNVSRELVVDAVVAANSNQSQTVKDIDRILGSAYLNREAKKDKRLRDAISMLTKHLKNGTLPEVLEAVETEEHELAKSLRDAVRGLRFAVRNSEPAIKQRLEADIGSLEAEIAQGGKPKGGKPQGREIPFPENLIPLRERRNALRSKLAQMQRQYKAEEELVKKIKETAKHLRDETLPEKTGAKRAKGDNRTEAFRDALNGLRYALRNSTQAQEERLSTTLQRLNDKLESLRNGTYVPPAKKKTQQRSKAIEELEYRIYRAESEINRAIQDKRPRTPFQKIGAPFNAARAIMTSYDFSGVVRQGGAIVFGHPLMAARALAPMFKATISDREAHRIHRKMMEHPNAPLWHRVGLDLTELDSLTGEQHQEEVFVSRWLNSPSVYRFDRKRDFAYTPFRLAKSGVHASQRAYVTFLNQLRVDAFTAMYDTLAINGEPTAQEATAIANFVNIATGRGDLGSAQRMAVQLNTIFFAPRYVASRFQFLFAQPLLGKASRDATWRVRREIGKEYARYMLGISMFHSMVALMVAGFAGEDDELEIRDGAVRVGDIYSVTFDPRSTDFAKMRFGDARLDPMSGLGQVAVLFSRGVTGQTRTGKGDVQPLRRSIVFGDQEAPGFGQDTAWDKLSRFTRYKFSPLVSYGLELYTGQDAIGQEVTPAASTVRLALPLSQRDMFRAFKEGGVSGGTALSLASIFGFGLNIYGDKYERPEVVTFSDALTGQ